ncbi:MAG: RraA family protein [Acidobacteriota bacterium]
MKATRIRLALLALAAALAGLGWQAAHRTAPAPADPLVAALAKVPTASLADAIDQVTGKRGFMSHDMRPQSPGSFAGRAATALLKPAPPEKATAQLSARDSVAMIDNAKPGEVGVIVIEDGLDVAALGGLMGTDAKVRGLAGMVLDAGVRDVGELREMKLPVYARSVVPSSTVGRFASVGRGMPVECAGVTVAPGDIIVADGDGVVSIPQDKAEEVLKRAQEIDERERKMAPLIRQYKSLLKVVQMFNRI